MALVRDFVQWIGSLAVQQTILSLVLVSSLLIAVEERRLSTLAFLGQYALLTLLLGGRVYQPVAVLKGLIGIPIVMILYISASHIEAERRRMKEILRVRSEGSDSQDAVSGGSDLPAAGQPRGARAPFFSALGGAAQAQGEHSPFHVAFVGMSPSFRILVVALGAAGAYGLWQAYPIALLAPQINLASYWLLATGILLTVTSQDPLRIGIGLLTLLNGFETAYYTLNTSLMLVGLMGTGEILIALVTANASERWLTSAAVSEETT